VDSASDGLNLDTSVPHATPDQIITPVPPPQSAPDSIPDPTEAPMPPPQTAPDPTSVFPDDARTYKLFFGEWEIVDFVRETQWSSEYFIGARFSYDWDGYHYNGHSFSTRYVYNIVPFVSATQMHVINRLTVQELGLEGNFFVYVMARLYSMETGEPICYTHWMGYSDGYPPGTHFYIKDDETLIVDINSGAYVAKRVSHFTVNRDGVERMVSFLPFP